MVAIPLGGLRLKRPGEVTTTEEIEALIAAGAPVAIGVSGGKDSSAVAVATVKYLRERGHTGPVILIHADLGRTEWKDSLPSCERLAAHLGVELVVVRRRAGDMLARWQGRWRANRKRWLELSCVKLILPWSTPAMRFCTSELKAAVIAAYLVRRFPGRRIVSVTGIRHDESRARAKKAVTAENKRLANKTHRTTGIDWNPIIEWPLAEVFRYLGEEGVGLHEAYTRYGSSRVSCCFCILGSKGDLRAASTCEDNADLYRWMVELEVESTFAFQDSGWLGDVAPHLLTEEHRTGLTRAKVRAAHRERIEAGIPKDLLYEKGWPKRAPTFDEAVLLSAVRWEVAGVMGLAKTFCRPAEVIARYEELLALKELKAKKKKARS